MRKPLKHLINFLTLMITILSLNIYFRIESNVRYIGFIAFLLIGMAFSNFPYNFRDKEE